MAKSSSSASSSSWRAPILVGVVESADGPFLDRTLRARGRTPCAVGLRLFFGGASGPKLRLREPGAPATAFRRPRREAAGPRAAEARWRAARPRSAEPSWPRTRRALVARARLADRQRPSLERLLVEPTDRFFSDRSRPCSRRTRILAAVRSPDRSGARFGAGAPTLDRCSRKSASVAE